MDKDQTLTSTRQSPWSPLFDQVEILHESLESEVAQRFLKIFPQQKIRIVESSSYPQTKGPLSAEEFSRSKRQLVLQKFKGHFFKRCPGATQKKTLSCCNYYVLNLGSQCNFNCSYCYLQSYLKQPAMQIFTNIEDAISELDEMAQLHSHLPYRVGTGEIIDSLSLDPLTLYSRKLIPFFAKYPKWTLEFKTKSANVDQFLDVPHAGNVVVSWSINAEAIISSEEHGTASLVERLAAARKCADKGFKIAFHLDPLIFHQNWRENYADLVRRLTSNFQAEEIHVVSLGALRFQPEQRHLMRERFGMKSAVVAAEMFPSEGGKMRYDQNLRAQMFQFVLNEFKSAGQKWPTFLCMETPESWLGSFEQTPMQDPQLHSFFRPLPKLKSEQNEARQV